MMIKDDKNTKNDCKNVEEKFDLPPISKAEFMVYLTYWLGVTIVGVYNVHTLAYRPTTLKHFKRELLMKKTYFGFYQSQVEYLWKGSVTVMNVGLKYMLIYVLVSRLIRSRASPMIFMAACTCITWFLHYYFSSFKFFAFECGIFLGIGVVGMLRIKTLVWMVGLGLLYKMKDFVMLSFFLEKHLFFNSFAYICTLITRGISVGLFVSEAQKYDLKLFLEMNLYFWYFPAVLSCRMMTIRDFVAQMYQPYIISNWKRFLSLTVRIFFVYILWSTLSILAPFYLVFDTHDIMSLDIFIVSGGQLFYGLQFYLIYFVIYNTVYLVSQLDGFLTAEGPECICHIALYSRMWRVFDVGMHLWIKDHIFRPLQDPNNRLRSKIIGVLASFFFVIIYHGLRYTTVTYVFVNIGQFFLQSYLIYAFNNGSLGSVMRRRLSPMWIRRVVAIVGAFSWIFSVYGFGVFSYGFDNANSIYFSLVKKNSNRFYYRLLVYLGLAYSHSQMALTANDYLDKRKIKSQ